MLPRPVTPPPSPPARALWRVQADQPVTFADFEAVVAEIMDEDHAVEHHRALALYHQAVDMSRERGCAEDSISVEIFLDVLAPVARKQLKGGIQKAIKSMRFTNMMSLGGASEPSADLQVLGGDAET